MIKEILQTNDIFDYFNLLTNRKDLDERKHLKEKRGFFPQIIVRSRNAILARKGLSYGDIV